MVFTILKILSLNCLGVISKVEIFENSIDTTGPRTVLLKTPFSMKIVKKVWIPSLMNLIFPVKNDLHYFRAKLSLLSKDFEAIRKDCVIVGVETCWQLIESWVWKCFVFKTLSMTYRKLVSIESLCFWADWKLVWVFESWVIRTFFYEFGNCLRGHNQIPCLQCFFIIGPFVFLRNILKYPFSSSFCYV